MAAILIIDDDPDALAILETFLEAQGHTAHVARNGQDGLDVLDREQPAVVIVDVMMPEMDGWEVARRIRDRPGLTQPRILMLTARDDMRSRQEAHDAGVDAYLVKPLSLEALATQIEKSLA